MLTTTITETPGYSLKLVAKRVSASPNSSKIFVTLNRRIFDTKFQEKTIFESNYNIFVDDSEVDKLISALEQIRTTKNGEQGV